MIRAYPLYSTQGRWNFIMENLEIIPSYSVSESFLVFQKLEMKTLHQRRRILDKGNSYLTTKYGLIAIITAKLL